MRIFVDFEATEAGEIIAIGAVTDTNARFFGTMAPKYSRITPRITALTGITEEEAENFPAAEDTVRSFVAWALNQGKDSGFHFFTFGKNDSGFAQKTRDFYAGQWGAVEIVMQLDFIRAHMSNGAAPIYEAFRKPLVSLRSAYLTYKHNYNVGVDAIHNPVEDAVMFKELVEAAEGGWMLPEDAEMVKAIKPTMPSKDVNKGVIIPGELDHRIVAYWVQKKTGKGIAQVFENAIHAARAICNQATMYGGIDSIQAAYRVLNAAINGETYCGRKFFLVD